MSAVTLGMPKKGPPLEKCGGCQRMLDVTGYRTDSPRPDTPREKLRDHSVTGKASQWLLCTCGHYTRYSP
jgi:hypothetical protein